MDFFHKILERALKTITPEEFDERLQQIPNNLNELNYDNWGMNPETVKHALTVAKYFFEHYFRVEVSGIEKVPEGRLLIIPNHSGQLPLDAVLLFYAMFAYAEPPRIVRAMVERFVPGLPFVNTFFARCGQVVGDPLNCRKLLENEEAVMVFPEGVRGSGKLIWQRYKLQRFGTGFMRLALETGAPIIPVAVVGAEETYPAVYNFKTFAKIFKLPYFPITPFWPFLGPLGMIPLPSKIHIYFGDPLTFTGDFDGPDQDVREKVRMVEQNIQKMIDAGLKKRAGKWLSGP